MSRTVLARFRTPLLIATTLSLAALATTVLPSTESQDGPLNGAVEGTITSTSGGALSGVSVTALHALTETERSTVSDNVGSYRLSLEAGNWSLTFARSGYESANDTVTSVPGQTKTLDKTLAPKSGPLRGVTIHVVEQDGEAPIAGVVVTLSGTGNDGTEVSEEATTGDTGIAEFEVPEGNYQVKAVKKGYGGGGSYLYVGTEPVEQTLWLYEVPEQTVRVTGRVLDEAGSGVQALVEIRPDYDGDVVYASEGRAEPASDTAASSVAPSCYGCGGYGNYNSTVSEEDGSFEMWAYAGEVVLSANKYDYLVAQKELTFEDNETYTETLTLEKAPPKDVTIEGKVVEAGSGKPLANAYVYVNGVEYPSWESAQTDKDGRFTLTTRRGYTQVSASHWEDTPVRDCPPEADCIAMPEPSGNLGRGHLSRVMTITLEAGETRTLTLELPKRPEPTSTILGYVLDEGNGVPNVSVNFYNEEMGDWGSATTDEDGSYKIRVRGGWFNVNIWADGYFGWSGNLRVRDGDTERLDVPLVAGTPKQMGWWGGDNNGCCYATPAYGGGYAVAEDSAASGGSSPMMTAGPGATGADAAERSSGSGGLTYQGGAGGLGPYDADERGETFEDSPAWGALATVAGLLGVAFGSRRRRSAE